LKEGRGVVKQAKMQGRGVVKQAALRRGVVNQA
jgi:hypothetical protein